MSNQQPPPTSLIPATLAGKSVVLVGLMGAGKPAWQAVGPQTGHGIRGRRRGDRSGGGQNRFRNIHRARRAAFRDGERRVIARAFVRKTARHRQAAARSWMPTPERTRGAGVSVWLKADLECCYIRVSRRNNRPLLQGGNKRRKLENLMTQRYPTYSEADVTVTTGEESPDSTVQKVYDALSEFPPVTNTSATRMTTNMERCGSILVNGRTTSLSSEHLLANAGQLFRRLLARAPAGLSQTKTSHPTISTQLRDRFGMRV